MSRKLVALLVVVWVGWSGAVVAQAEGFDVTLSVTAGVGPGGFSLADSSVTAIVSTTMNGVSFTSTTACSLGFEFLGETVDISGKINDYNVLDEIFFDLKNPISKTLTVSTKLGSWKWSSTTAMSIAMDFSKFELTGETLKVGTTTKEGVSLSSATTLAFSGFKKEVVALSGTLLGVYVAETTSVTQSGSFTAIWDMSTTVEGFNLSRETIYTGAGFSSDSLTVGWTVDKYDLSVTGNFGKTGWTNLSLTGSRTFKGVGAPPKKEEPKP